MEDEYLSLQMGDKEEFGSCSGSFASHGGNGGEERRKD